MFLKLDIKLDQIRSIQLPKYSLSTHDVPGSVLRAGAAPENTTDTSALVVLMQDGFGYSSLHLNTSLTVSFKMEMKINVSLKYFL